MLILKPLSTVAAAGGLDRIAKQHAAGKLTARERMEALFDDGTFVELDDMITSRATDFGMDKKKRPGDGVVTGYGYIHGRIAFAASQTCSSSSPSLNAKSSRSSSAWTARIAVSGSAPLTAESRRSLSCTRNACSDMSDVPSFVGAEHRLLQVLF